MDIYSSSRERFNKYYLALAQSEDYSLSDTAKIVSSRHIKDFLLRARFEAEIRSFIDANFNVIRNAKTDKECRQAIDNINQEKRYLEQQGTRLPLRQAKVFMTVSMERHNKEIFYLVKGIGLVVNGLQIYGGFGMLARAGFAIGKIAGAHLIISGVSSFSENLARLLKMMNIQVLWKKVIRYQLNSWGLTKSMVLWLIISWT